ncbi:DUF5682 family protein [Streptomyces sp. NPDC002067]
MSGPAGGRGSGAAGATEPVLLGVRHHGPGSARAVRAALERTAPRAVLIEGPPEADALVPLAGHPGMRPPVALLAHVRDAPGRSAFWPLAEFSPEWVALRWALEREVPVRFIDLPAAHSLAMPEPAPGPAPERGGEARPDTGAGRAPDGPHRGGPPDTAETRDAAPGPDGTPDAAAAPGLPGEESAGDEAASGTADAALRTDPLGALARAAGYDDAEAWWEDVVEHRTGGGAGETDALAPFAAVAEAMSALRETYGDGGRSDDPVREAHMRLRIRAARREFGDRVAVVCGAWHVPALTRRTTVAADRRLLTGLPKVKTELTWVPWTHRRLSRHSGYGAGIASPGWYGHLFRAPDRPVERWLTRAAGLLREEDYAVSPAHVIEAVRLAQGLAAVRGRPLPGLAETTDAIRAVMGDGSDVPAALIHDRLVVGDALGEVPDDAPAVPLQRDLTRTARTLRLKPEAAERELELDLRKETDAGRSRLLHRLRLLGIPWGEPVRSRTTTGTFRETWRLRWEPELSVKVAEAGIWGTTVRSAATAKAEADAGAATVLAEVTAVAESCLLTGLSDALPQVMRVLADRAALDTDVGRLAQALPALVRAVRYGDVRGTDGAALREVAAGLAERVFVGLPSACAGLDADAATEMRGHLDATHRAVTLLSRPEATGGAGAPETAEEAGATGTDADTERARATEATESAESGATEGTRLAETPECAGLAESANGLDASVSSVSSERAGAGESAESTEITAISGPTQHVNVTASLTALAPTTDAPAPDPPTTEPPPATPGPATSDVTPGDRWARALRAVAGRERVPGLLRGRAARLLRDDGRLGDEGVERLMGLALSPAAPPADAAGWIEGFAGGGDGDGMLLVHDERLLALVDGWLTGVPPEAFTDVLPLLRRTFAGYGPGVRRALGELIRRGPAALAPRAPGPGAGPDDAVPVPGFGPGLDRDRAAAVLPVLHLLLDSAPYADDPLGRAC